MTHRNVARLRSGILLIAVALVVLAPAPRAHSPAVNAAIDAFRERLRSDVAADAIGGITAAVVVGDRILWAEGFGFADRGARTPAGIETIYRIGSISKTFTAVLLAQLVDRKIVGLDDPVEKYFPEVRGFAEPQPGAKPITFRQLASHTAGLIREPRLQGAASGAIAQWEEKILAAIPTTSFNAVPVPVMPFAASSGYSPSGTRQTMSPVVVLTATSSDQGGSLHG